MPPPPPPLALAHTLTLPTLLAVAVPPPAVLLRTALTVPLKLALALPVPPPTTDAVAPALLVPLEAPEYDGAGVGEAETVEVGVPPSVCVDRAVLLELAEPPPPPRAPPPLLSVPLGDTLLAGDAEPPSEPVLLVHCEDVALALTLGAPPEALTEALGHTLGVLLPSMLLLGAAEAVAAS